jgi:hypothetical protein
MEITIADLVTIRNIIDLAVARGAFRAAEVKQVGEAFDKLSQFLDQTLAQAQSSADSIEESQGE